MTTICLLYWSICRWMSAIGSALAGGCTHPTTNTVAITAVASRLILGIMGKSLASLCEFVSGYANSTFTKFQGNLKLSLPPSVQPGDLHAAHVECG